jgi:putative ATPase
MQIRNAPTKMMEDLGYGKGYKYAHDYKDAKVDQEHFPPELKGRRYS